MLASPRAVGVAVGGASMGRYLLLSAAQARGLVTIVIAAAMATVAVSPCGVGHTTTTMRYPRRPVYVSAACLHLLLLLLRSTPCHAECTGAPRRRRRPKGGPRPALTTAAAETDRTDPCSLSGALARSIAEQSSGAVVGRSERRG